MPDPEAFRDAVFLSKYGRWSATELDATDALTLTLVRRLQSPRKK